MGTMEMKIFFSNDPMTTKLRETNGAAAVNEVRQKCNFPGAELLTVKITLSAVGGARRYEFDGPDNYVEQATAIMEK